MRIALALVVGLFVVGCSHVDAVSDDPRLAVLERVHPNGHIPAIEHRSAAVGVDEELTPAPASRSKTSLVARNETDVVPSDDVSSIVGPSSKASAADEAFNSGTAKSKKSAKAKKTRHHSSHHQTQQ